MTDNSTDEFDKHSSPGKLRIARAGEPAFYGGPLDGSFDFTEADDVELDWCFRASTTIHRYERDVTKRMYYVGVVSKHNNDHQADGA